MSETTSLPSRLEYLTTHLAESIDAQSRLVDWRILAGWVALSGASAGVTALSFSIPAFTLAVLVVIIAIIAYFGLSFRAQSRSLASLRDLVDASSGGEWDRSGVDTLPPVYLYPEDATSGAQLERILRPTPEDRAQLPGATRRTTPVLLAAMTVGIAGMLGLLLWILEFPGWTPDAAGRATVLAASVPFVLGGVAAFRYNHAVRAVYNRVVERARAQASRLWETDPTFTTGLIVRPDSTTYRIDPAGLPLGVVPLWRKRSVRLLLVAIGVLAVLLGALRHPAAG